MNHYVYEITNLVNEKKYIGKRSCNCTIEEDEYMGSGKILQDSIKKYGIENFKKEILLVCPTEEVVHEMEDYFIKKYQSTGVPLYNIYNNECIKDTFENLEPLTNYPKEKKTKPNANNNIKYKNIIITKRDEKIKEFLEDIEVADTKTIHALFFANTGMRNAQKRLSQLVDVKFIKVYREDILSQNVYYAKYKPKNIKHKIAFSQLLGKLKECKVDVLEYKCPYIVNHVIADGFVTFVYNDRVYQWFVEAENTKNLNSKKYVKLFYEDKYKTNLGIVPQILCITNKRKMLIDKRLNVLMCRWDFENFNIDECLNNCQDMIMYEDYLKSGEIY